MAEARRLFINALKWRKENKIDTILLEKHEVHIHTTWIAHHADSIITNLHRHMSPHRG